MKKLADYLTESKKTYSFKVGLAGELPEGFRDRLEVALKKFGLVELSKGKTTPIQERPLDFPRLENTEVTYFDVEVSYPTTPQVLGEYISKCESVEPGYLQVVNPNAQAIADGDQEGEARTESDEPYMSLITSEYKDPIESKDAQAEVGENRVMDLLKELEVARKERAHDPMEGAPKGESKDIDTTENATSVIGD